MRRIVGTLTIGSAVVLAPACGGGVFTEATGDEAGASDVGVSSDVLRSSDGAPSSDGASSDVASSSDGGPRDGGPNDGGALDGSDVTTDAAGSDAPGMPDVIEEPPPHCGGAFTCAPIVPSGWTGPLELYAGSSAAPSCGASFTGPAFDGNAGLSVPGSKCDCQCQNAQGVQCSSPTISFYGSSAACSPESTSAPGARTLASRSRCLPRLPRRLAGVARLWRSGTCRLPLGRRTRAPVFRRSARRKVTARRAPFARLIRRPRSGPACVSPSRGTLGARQAVILSSSSSTAP
jgi:hypothetical protein